jgi:hypothetical protein
MPSPLRPSTRSWIGAWLSAAGIVSLAPSLHAAPARPYDGPAAVVGPTDVEAIEPAPAEPEPAEPEPAAPEPAAPEPIAPEPAPEKPAEATGEPLRWPNRFVYRNLMAVRANPLGAVDDAVFGYRRQLFRRDTPLLRDSYALLGAHGLLTPAFARFGPTVELQPAAVFNLGATYDFIGAWGLFQQVRSFPSASARWGPRELWRPGEHLHYGTRGHLVTLSSQQQFRVWRFALRNNLRAYWSHMHLRGRDRVYYDQVIDMLMPQDGWALTNDTDLIYLFPRGLRLLVRHSLTHAFYGRRHFLPGEPVSQPNGPTSRLGPVVAYTFFDRPGVRFNKPTLIVLAQWWLRHRFRTGEELSAGIPYAAVAFSFEGDLLPFRRDTARGKGRARRRG